MRSLVIAMLLIVSSTALAQSAISGSDTKALLAWHHECDPSGTMCWLEKIVTFKSQVGMEQGGVAIAYDAKKEQPEFISVIVPNNVRANSVQIRFLDSVKKGGKWAVVPVGGFIDLAVSSCDKSSCQARIHPQIPSGPNLFEEIRQRRFMWVLFKRGGALERFIVPLSGVNQELKVCGNNLTTRSRRTAAPPLNSSVIRQRDSSHASKRTHRATLGSRARCS